MNTGHQSGIPSESMIAQTSPHSETVSSEESAKDTPGEQQSKESTSRVTKRRLNTLAARRYRQRRVDQVKNLEAELEKVKRERDELMLRVSKLEGETDILRSLLKDGKGSK